MYDTGSDVLGVLIARAAGQPFETFLRERLFEPLGMKDTGFSVPAGKIGRLATSYWSGPKSGAMEVYDPAEGGQWSRPPAFPSAAGGLVSTVDDYLAFGRMLLNRGRTARSASCRVGRGHDHRSADARAEGALRLRARLLGQPRVGLRDVRDHPARRRGRGARAIRVGRGPRHLVGVGSDGRAGRHPDDPAHVDLPQGPDVYHDFWTQAYQAIDD